MMNKKKIMFVFLAIILCVGANIYSMALIEAVKKGNLNKVRKILEKSAIEVNTKVKGFFPLGQACFLGLNDKTLLYREIVELLIENGANVNSDKDKFGMTPFKLACILESKSFKGSEGIVRLFLENGAKIDRKCIDIIKNCDQASKYIGAILNYNRLEKKGKGEIKYILCFKDKDKDVFNFLVRVALGRAIQKNDNNKYTPIRSTVFYRLYKEISQKDLREIFGVAYSKDIFEFIKNILRNRSKNHFYVDKLFFEQEQLKKNLFGKTKGKKPYADLIVHTEEK